MQQSRPGSSQSPRWRATCRRGVLRRSIQRSRWLRSDAWTRAIRVQQTRHVRDTRLMMISNVRYAIRVLRRTPGFTLIVVLTFALGIGANSVVFSAMNAILWQPLGFPDADRLVSVNQSIPNAPVSNTAPVRIEEWNEQSTAFAAITGYYPQDVSETSGA